MPDPTLTVAHGHPGVLRRYAERLPLTSDTPRISLGEGDTPLVRSRRLVERAGCKELYFKLEMCNPTGSFKDRGMVVAIAKAMESGAKAVLCASTGNTSASAAAYAAHCGLDAYVLVPEGNIAMGKLAQAVAHGAKILAVKGNFDDALKIARRVSEEHPVALVNFPAEARELITRANSERDQLAQRIALSEKLGGELTEELQRLTHHVAKIDQRQQVQNAQIMDLMGRVGETSEQLQAQLKRVFQLLLRQRRRQMDTLAQEIKELGQGEHHGGDKPNA